MSSTGMATLLALLLSLTVNAQDPPLHEAAKEGNTAEVSALLQAGADQRQRLPLVPLHEPLWRFVFLTTESTPG